MVKWSEWFKGSVPPSNLVADVPCEGNGLAIRICTYSRQEDGKVGYRLSLTGTPEALDNINAAKGLARGEYNRVAAPLDDKSIFIGLVIGAPCVTEGQLNTVLDAWCSARGISCSVPAVCAAISKDEQAHLKRWNQSH